MSVLSVEPLALGGPGEIGAERAHRPGSRRLGGVEATGASVATADSWPDRRKGWASPEWGPALRLAVMGGVVPGRAYGATLFAGGLPLLFPGVLVVQVLLQCFPGLLLRFISLKTRPDNKEQAGAPCAENTKAPSAERGATKK